MTFTPQTRTAVIVVALMACLTASGCGKRDSLIPKTDAQALLQQLDVIEQQLTSGACDQLPASIADAQDRVNALPSSVDRELRGRIELGLANLTTQAPRDCAAGTLTTTTQTTTTQTTATTETQTTPTATTPEPTVTTTTPQPTPTTTTPAPTPTPTTTTPSGGAGTGGTGGSGGTGGVSPNTGGASP